MPTGIITDIKAPITRMCKETLYKEGWGMKIEVIKLFGIPIYKLMKETSGFEVQSDGTFTRTASLLFQ